MFMGLVASKVIVSHSQVLNKNANVNYYDLIHGCLSIGKNRIKKQK